MALLATSAGPVRAHSLGQSYVFLTILDRGMEGRVEITVADLNKALGLGLLTDGTASMDDIAAHGEAIERYVFERFTLAPDGTHAALRATGHDLLTIHGRAQFAIVRFAVENLTEVPEFVDVHYAVLFDEDPQHVAMLVIEQNWLTGTFDNEAQVSLVFDPANRSARLDLSGSTVLRGLYEMVRLGTHHIFIGIDHILFLLALLLPSVFHRDRRAWYPTDSFRAALWYVVKIVTTFTIAHTITLSLATLGAITAPSRLVESIIALSIAIAAADIIYPLFKRRIWLVVFGFGLFHGLGFAGVLSEMNIPSAYMAWSLLGFNVGVEIGQVAIVCMVFPVLYLSRNMTLYSRVGLQSGAFGLIAISLYWFIERAFEVDLPAGEMVQRLLGIVV